MSSVIAAQLYTLREFTKTPEGIAETFSKVRAIGYEAVQVSALGPIAPQKLAEIAAGNDLQICATHVSFDRLRDEPEQIAQEHELWGCSYPAIGGMPAEYRGSLEGFRKFAADASAVGRKLKEYGLTFGYHNHSFELQRFGAHSGLEILYNESDPEAVTAEIDTYWIQHGGGDPAWWIRKLAGRIPLLHLKDMTVVEEGPVMAEVGEGNLNWEAILAAAREAGVEWYIVEQDTCRRDPFESLEISLRNLRKMGLK